MLGLKLSAIGAVTIKDDRGADCPLVGPPEKWPKGGWSGKSKQPLDAAMSVEWEWAQAAAGAFGATIGLTMVLTMGVARWLLQALPPLPGWLGSAAPTILVAILVRPAYLPIASSLRRKRAAELRAAYVKVRRCASCGYDLIGLPVENDGCTTCPECARAWRIPVQAAPASLTATR